MIEQLISMIKQTSQEVIEQNPDVPNDQNESVSNIASESIVGTMQNLMSNGGIAGIMSMFSGNEAAKEGNNPVIQNAMSDFSGNLMNKLGVSSEKANGIAASIIPMILSKLLNKSGNGGGIDLSSILGSFSGGQGGGLDLGSIVSKLGASGLDVNKDGKTDFNDLTTALGAGKGEEGSNDADKDGDIFGKLSGLFGK